MEHPFVQFGSALLALLTLWLHEHLVPGRAWDTEKSLIRVSTAEQHLKHLCINNIILRRNPKHRTVPLTRKEANSIPAKTMTVECRILACALLHCPDQMRHTHWPALLMICNTCYKLLLFISFTYLLSPSSLAL